MKGPRIKAKVAPWETKRIGDFTTVISGGTPSTRNAHYWGGDIRWMSSGELNLKRVYEVVGRITDAGLKNSSTRLVPRKCVLIGLAGQGKTRGTAAINYVDLCTNQSIASIIPNDTFIPEYLYFNVDSRYNELRGLSTGDGGRGGLNLSIIKNFIIPFPDKKEQAAIAIVLSDIDALMGSLERLVIKKRGIMQGTMQLLLTGETRLPGFTGLWNEKQLGEISYIGRGRVINHKEIDASINQQYPVYSSQTSNDGIMGYLDSYMFDGEYVTWTTDGEKAGTPFYRSGRFNCTNVCGTIKLKNDNPQFIAYLLKREMPKYVSRNLANPKLMNDIAKKIELRIPSSKEEQIAIAKVLGDMDSEINQLERKRNKYKMIKQGMMQQLLTGKIRLI